MKGALCIVGASGKMGEFFSRRWRALGYEVYGLGRPWAEAEEFLGRVRVVLLSVPVSALRGALAALAPRLSPERHILADLTSVKALPLRWMEEAFAGPVVGTHPLFGPAPLPEDLRVALVRGRAAGGAECALLEELFAALGCRTFWAGAEEHDAGVAFSQSLNFMASAAFFSALSRREGVSRFLTPSFRRHLEAARKHLTQDTAMFLEFTRYNPSFPEALECYREILREAAGGGAERIAGEAARWYAGRDKD